MPVQSGKPPVHFRQNINWFRALRIRDQGDQIGQSFVYILGDNLIWKVFRHLHTIKVGLILDHFFVVRVMH
jgi:hypothetical protein